MKNIEELAYKLELNSNSPLSKWMLKASHLNVSGDKFPSSFHIPCAYASYCAWRVDSEMWHVLFEKTNGKCCGNDSVC